MKRFLSVSVIVMLTLVSPVMAQNGDEKAAPSASGVNTLDELWWFQDAVPVDAGSVDLRFSFGWETSGWPGNAGDSDDDFVLTPSLVWGSCENVEVSFNVPLWLGDGGNRGGFDEGNYDTNVGVLWRISQQADNGHADFALAGNFRIPTGDGSNGVDYEARLAVTRTYDSGIRSHFNLWGKVVNGDNNKSMVGDADFSILAVARDLDDERDFQYGANIGVDYPLCDDGAVRLVLDYMHRSSVMEGQNNWNMAEIGWEWDMSDADRLGMSLQFNVDRSNDAPNAGAVLTFAHALTF